MDNLIFSQIPLDQLKKELTEDLLKEIGIYFQKVNTPTPQTELISRKEASALLGISLPTLLNWTNKGQITGYRIASRIRYKRNEIENSLLKIKVGR